VTSAGERLATFNAVQNTYLLIFQLLGGLGLLLGSIGVGMVVLRNTLERRSELALLGAVGYPARAIRRLVWSEHGALLGLGLASGVVAALLAVLPGGSGGRSMVPMAVLVVAVAGSGALWVWVASTLATQGPLLDALRNE
jgi:putative ABC transport system permease protein